MNLPKNAQLWLPAYLASRARARTLPPAKRLWVALTDHYEPLAGNPIEIGRRRVKLWSDLWPRIAAAAPPDASGQPPVFTFFYPQEEYHPELLDLLSQIPHTDVEVHIHHDHDTAQQFTDKIATFRDTLHHRHALLRQHNGQLAFGFIHGNWALDNSRPDGRWCGVTGELHILRSLGCYADFTMPSIPSPTQSRVLNQIYWATGSPTRPRAFDTGIEASPGGGTHPGLLMVTGPAGLRFRRSLIPRIETGELAHYDPPTADRVARWLALAPRIGDDIFLKLYGHSASEYNSAALLGASVQPGAPVQPGTLAPMFQWIAEAARQHNLELHWASAWQMFQAIESLTQPNSVEA